MLNDQDESDERRRGLHGVGGGRTPGAARERDVTGRIETSREPRTPRVDPAGEPDVATAAVLPDEATPTRRGPARVTDYLFLAIYSLLGLRLLTALLDVRGDTGFGRTVTAFTDPLYTPFRAIVDNPTDDTGRMLALPVLIALVAYMILHALIRVAWRAVWGNAPDSM